ncbi:LysR family transcriptional regulator [Curtobacterium sp. MCBD17_019]|nr:LysR family transcriptional regulator [Curtobacterium sp. MCBD17_019]
MPSFFAAVSGFIVCSCAMPTRVRDPPRSYARRMPGTLTVAFVPGVSPARWARVWRERMPDVELVLRAVGADEVDRALDGDADMCFARLPVTEGLRAIPLWTETPVVAAPKDSEFAEVDSVTERDLVGMTLLGGGPVPDDLDGTLDLVAAGVGLAVLPQSLFRAASRRDLVARPLVDVEGTRVALVWRDADASPVTDEFIGIVRGRTANSSRGRDAADVRDADGTDGRQTHGRVSSDGREARGRPGADGREARRGSGNESNGRPGTAGGRGRTARPTRGRPRRGR